MREMLIAAKEFPGAISMIERSHAVPLYHQIFLGLRDEITSGLRKFGSALPTEFELAAKAGVSRITAKRALDELAAEGMVERRRKTGTRVIYRATNAPLAASVSQAVESLIAFSRGTKVSLVHLNTIEPSETVAEKLRLMPGERVVHAVRLRSRDGETLGQVESYVPTAIAARIPETSLASVPLLVLIREAGVEIGGGQQTISAITATPELAAALNIEPRSAVLNIERVVTDAQGTPVLMTVARYRADRYQISLDLK